MRRRRNIASRQAHGGSRQFKVPLGMHAEAGVTNCPASVAKPPDCVFKIFLPSCNPSNGSRKTDWNNWTTLEKNRKFQVSKKIPEKIENQHFTACRRAKASLAKAGQAGQNRSWQFHVDFSRNNFDLIRCRRQSQNQRAAARWQRWKTESSWVSLCVLKWKTVASLFIFHFFLRIFDNRENFPLFDLFSSFVLRNHRFFSLQKPLSKRLSRGTLIVLEMKLPRVFTLSALFLENQFFVFFWKFEIQNFDVDFHIF